MWKIGEFSLQFEEEEIEGKGVGLGIEGVDELVCRH